MKYVKNNGRYAMAYTYMAGEREVKVELDRQRVYMDTGNIATTGITALEDKVFEALKENKVFAEDLAKGILAEVAKPSTSNNELEALRAENEKLQKKLDKDSSAKALEKLEAEKAQLEKVNADMKAQLEALATNSQNQKRLMLQSQ